MSQVRSPRRTVRRPEALLTPFALGLAMLTMVTGGAGVALAQKELPAPPAKQAGEDQETNPASPRGAVERYLETSRGGDFEKAALWLDLRAFPPAVRESRGPELARMVKSVLDQKLWIEPGRLSNAPDGNLDDGLPPDREVVGVIRTADDEVKITLERVTEPDGSRVWRFSAATVDEIPGLFALFGRSWLEDYLPSWLFEVQFLSVRLWQWFGIVLLVPLSVFLGWLAARVALRILHGVLRRSMPRFELGLMAITEGPLRLIFGVAFFIIGEGFLQLPLGAHRVFGVIRGALIVATLTFLALRLVDVLGQSVEHRLRQQAKIAALSVVPLARRVAKVFLVAVSALFMLQDLGLNVTTLLAGLGVTGVALAFGAQKTVENLFSGFALVGDQPVRVGDFCRFGDRVGIVEDIGLWATRIRSLDRTVVSIPNSTFAFMQLENFAKRDFIWFHPSIQLRKDTSAEQLRYVLVEIKKVLLGHPRVSPSPARIRFEGFGPYSLNLEIFAYVLTEDINEFLKIQEDLLLRIMDVVEASGTGLAVPAQRLFTAADQGLDEERTRAAEQQVSAWRAANSLFLPDVPEDRAAALAGTLAYPPEGSATRGV